MPRGEEKWEKEKCIWRNGVWKIFQFHEKYKSRDPKTQQNLSIKKTTPRHTVKLLKS